MSKPDTRATHNGVLQETDPYKTRNWFVHNVALHLQLCFDCIKYKKVQKSRKSTSWSLLDKMSCFSFWQYRMISNQSTVTWEAEVRMLSRKHYWMFEDYKLWETSN